MAMRKALIALCLFPTLQAFNAFPSLRAMEPPAEQPIDEGKGRPSTYGLEPTASTGTEPTRSNDIPPDRGGNAAQEKRKGDPSGDWNRKWNKEWNRESDRNARSIPYDFESARSSDSGTAADIPSSGRDSLHILDLAGAGNHIWAVTAQWGLLHSADAGASWSRVGLGSRWERIPERLGLSRILFMDTALGFVATGKGRFHATRDGGRTWRLLRAGTPAPGALMISDSAGAMGWMAVGDDSYRIESRDGGESWTNRTAEAWGYRSGFLLQPLQPGWSASGKRVVFATRADDGSGGLDLRTRTLYLAGDSGKVGRYTANDGLVRLAPVPGRPALYSVHFRTTRAGLVGGDGGLLARTADGGATWDTLRLPAKGKILAIGFLDMRHGFAVGEKGLLYETRDGGATWKRGSRSPADPIKGDYLRFPPPGYFLLLLIVAALVWPVIRAPKAEVVEESIADQLVSDRPLEDPRLDVLGLARKAEALAEFLGNPRTEPPLTFGIMGEWGRGKSSFMNLLRNRLDRDGFTTVWFNAWHHQSEESLLASLLETLKRTRIAPWWTLDGMRFRLNLIRRRALHGRETEWLMLLAGLVLFLVLCRWNPLHLRWDYSSLGALFAAAAEGDWADRLAGAGGFLMTLLPLGVSFLTFSRLLRKALVVFNTQPSRLLADLAGNATLKDMSAKIGFREEFRREFSEVAEALRHAPLVVFIDDLDRCQPDKVMEILESINFLVTCGPCYFVVAMDKRQITRAIIVNDDAVIRMFNDKGEAHAQEYLEKIINIEVAVPEPDPAAYQRLMTHAEPPPAGRAATRQWQMALKNLPLYLVLGFLLYLSLSLLQAPGRDPSPGAAPSAGRGTALHPEGTGGAGGGNEGPVAKGAEGKADALRAGGNLPTEAGLGSLLPFKWDSGPIQFRGGTQAAWTRPFAVSVPILCAGLFLWGVLYWSLQRRRRSFRDSSDFLRAVDEWHHLIFLGAKTPRAVKKFLNRLRFFAVLRRNSSAGPAGRSILDDSDLVALSTLELGMRSLLPGEEINRENLGKIETYLRENYPASPVLQSIQVLIQRGDISDLLNHFRDLGAHVQVNT